MKKFLGGTIGCFFFQGKLWKGGGGAGRDCWEGLLEGQPTERRRTCEAVTNLVSTMFRTVPCAAHPILLIPSLPRLVFSVYSRPLHEQQPERSRRLQQLEGRRRRKVLFISFFFFSCTGKHKTTQQHNRRRFVEQQQPSHEPRWRLALRVDRWLHRDYQVGRRLGQPSFAEYVCMFTLAFYHCFCLVCRFKNIGRRLNVVVYHANTNRSLANRCMDVDACMDML